MIKKKMNAKINQIEVKKKKNPSEHFHLSIQNTKFPNKDDAQSNEKEK